MRTAASLAVFGGAPLFAHPPATGQQHFPEWAQFESMFRDIFARQYYTNQGPLAQALERRLAERLGVRHAICVANEFIGLVSAAQALDVRGDVVVPAHGPVATPMTLGWSGARPLFCDVDPQTGMLTAGQVAPFLARNGVSAILGVNPWGDACEVEALQALAARHGIPLYFDSSHGFGCEIAGRPLGGFGAIEVISFHSDNILGSCEGAVVCVGDDHLAARVRNIRSSYGMGAPVSVVKTANGRMSEAQAAVALFNLDRYPEHRERNVRMHEVFRAGLTEVPGIEVRVPAGVSRSNHQNLICRIDGTAFGMGRDDLWHALRHENVRARKGFAPPAHVAFAGSRPAADRPLPVTEHYSATTLELPLHRALTTADASRLVEVLGAIQRNAGDVRRRLEAMA